MKRQLNNKINRFLKLHEKGEDTQLEKKCKKFLESNKHYYIYNLLGLSLLQQNKDIEALKAFKMTISLNPNFENAYYNSGNTLIKLGRLKEAILEFDKALELNKNFIEVHNDKANVLEAFGMLDEALESYKKAININQDFAPAHYNIGNILTKQGKVAEAFLRYQKAVSIDSTNKRYCQKYAETFQLVDINLYDATIFNELIILLEMPTVRPYDISGQISKILKLHPSIENALKLINNTNLAKDINVVAESLVKIPLLITFIKLSPIVDFQLETLFTQIRNVILDIVYSGKEKVKGENFYYALASHCAINDYVYLENQSETNKIDILIKNIQKYVKEKIIIPSIWIATLGAYRALDQFQWLKKARYNKDINFIINEQIDKVDKEKRLRKLVKQLTNIDNDISKKVQIQYEDNPYPRWKKISVNGNQSSIAEVLKSINVFEQLSKETKFSQSPEVLIAGCGTGQHAIRTASTFKNCHVTAMDLSLSSIAYAQRKTKEHGITNISYKHGDILQLYKTNKTFDIIESVGVLHHMENPVEGWKQLVEHLKDNGLMRIGLYSKLARKCVDQARQYIFEKGYRPTKEDIRQCRYDIVEMAKSNNSVLKPLINSHDFYSLNSCRDLIFHVQEHCFTIPQIRKILYELNLTFLGFHTNSSIVKRFAEQYPQKKDIYNLSFWDEFEHKNPEIFGGMYQFWVQKNNVSNVSTGSLKALG